MAPFCWAPCDFESVHEIFVMPSAFLSLSRDVMVAENT